jgi:hypothetical protein
VFGTQLSLGIDEAIESLARDAQLLAHVADLGVTLGQSGLSEPQLGGRHRVGPDAVATTRPRATYKLSHNHILFGRQRTARNRVAAARLFRPGFDS